MRDRPHFIWIMVDSVRRYHTTGDDEIATILYG